MSRSMNTNNRKKKTEADEVEELLRAAEDDVFLKLSLNSHMARGSSTQFIDPDLDQRFQSLKSKKTPKNKNPSIPQQKHPSASITTPTLTTTTTTEDSGDDLFARFAALKSSLPSSASTSANKQQAPVVEINEDGEEDEVEKVIKWAIDAARLDPSPPSDTDDENRSSSDDAEEEDEDSDDDKVKRAKTKAKRK